LNEGTDLLRLEVSAMTEQPTQDAQTGPGTAEHDRLKPFAGIFSAVIKLFRGSGEPMISTGTMVNDWVLGERYLRQTFAGDPVDGSHQAFAGVGFWGFDPARGVYQSFWVDNASTTMQIETGTVDAAGKVWTMRGTMLNPQSRETMNKRSIITLQDSDHHLVESFFTVGNGEEFKAMELIYTRKS